MSLGSGDKALCAPRPITWHDLRHQFVSLLIAAGKHPKYISQQAGHSSAGFTLDRYGSLFETLPITPVEWWDDLIWSGGWHHSGTTEADIRHAKTEEMPTGEAVETPLHEGFQR